MNRKTLILQSLVLVFFVLGCTSIDLSSPEKNYESVYRAIKVKNFDMFSKCFQTDAELYNEKNLRILADKMFNDIDIVSHRIIKKEKTGEKEASIVAEEISQRKDGIRTKSTFRINYINSGGIWKIISSETLSFEKLTDK
jgi:hypothetical protein